jgi:short-subunit dehydrogenase
LPKEEEMPKKPEPRRALVTGASSGIGAALAQRLASRGIEVYLAARRKEPLEQQAEEIRKQGGRAHTLTLDIADADATYATLRGVDEDTGGIDLVVANAAQVGAPTDIGLEETPWARFRDTVQTNLLGSTATLLAFIPGMLARGHGQLVGISSLAADSPNPRSPAYGTSKAGLTYFLDTADITLRPRGIAVTIVHPGFVRTTALEGLPDKLPFIVELDRAIDIIDRAIRKRARLVRFPVPLALLSHLHTLLPRALSHPFILRATAAPSSPEEKR